MLCARPARLQFQCENPPLSALRGRESESVAVSCVTLVQQLCCPGDTGPFTAARVSCLDVEGELSIQSAFLGTSSSDDTSAELRSRSARAKEPPPTIHQDSGKSKVLVFFRV